MYIIKTLYVQKEKRVWKITSSTISAVFYFLKVPIKKHLTVQTVNEISTFQQLNLLVLILMRLSAKIANDQCSR